MIIGDGAITLARVDDVDDEAVARSRPAAGLRAARACTSRAERLRLSTPTAETSCCRQAAAAGVDFVAVSFVRRAADMLDGSRGRRRPGTGWSPRSRRLRRSANWRRSSTSPTR